MNFQTKVSYNRQNRFILFNLAVEFFTEILGPEEEDKISHVTEIELPERGSGLKVVDPGPPEKKMTLI